MTVIAFLFAMHAVNAYCYLKELEKKIYMDWRPETYAGVPAVLFLELAVAAGLVLGLLWYRKHGKDGQRKNPGFGMFLAGILGAGELTEFFFLLAVRHGFDAFYYYVGYPLGTAAFVCMAGICCKLYKVCTADRLAREKAEEQQEQVSLVISQVQSYFIFNALTVIRYLTKKDPDSAYQMTYDFATYLRYNFDAVQSDGMTSFSREIKHTRAYLGIEKQRFPDKIQVEWELQDVAFNIPLLTLQPLVENAVHYGLTKKAEGGTVKISTWADETFHYICVEDNGAGSTPEEVESRKEIKNVRRRLARLKNAKLSIETQEGTGTKAMIMMQRYKRRSYEDNTGR